MMNWVKTKFAGVRYREHATRKNGVGADRYFCLSYWLGGKTKSEAVGWSSEGWTAEKAHKLLSTLRENQRTGSGPQTLAQLRETNQAQTEAEKAEQKARSKSLTTFAEYWQAHYWPHALAGKTPKSIETEEGYYRKWLAPAFGDVALSKITPALLEGLIADMRKNGKKPGTIVKALGTFSLVWNRAKLHDFVSGDCPVQRVKKPSQDNRRMRFLSQDEAQTLLDALKRHSGDTHDAATLALYAGLRAGEIHKLTWQDVDFSNGLLTVKDAKDGKTRHAYITRNILPVLQSRHAGQDKAALVFPAREGMIRVRVSKVYNRVVKELGFNAGVKDDRDKVVFHTLRHTFASWLVQKGIPIFTVAQLMGHSSIVMTQRYSHLAPDATRRAAMQLEGILDKAPARVIPFHGAGG